MKISSAPQRPFGEVLSDRMHPLAIADMMAFVRANRDAAAWRREAEDWRSRPSAAPSGRMSACPPEDPSSSPRASKAVGCIVPLAVGAATAIGFYLLLFSNEIAAFFGGVAKLLFHGSLPPMPTIVAKGDLADVSVYAPPSVARGDVFLIQVFVHSDTETEDVIARLATDADFAATRRAFSTLDLLIENGDRLDVTVEGAGLEIEELSQTITWRGKPTSCVFMVRVPPDYSRPAGHVRVRIFRQLIPIGRISFAIGVTAEAMTNALAPVGDLARKYQRAFLSYASVDRSEVLKRAQALRAARIDFFADLLSLEPGERWEKRLYQEIENCDLFLLFWSSAASNSNWVQKEIEHALACISNSVSDRPEILPIILEGPPPPPPPASLAAYHFNDPLSYVIAADERSS